MSLPAAALEAGMVATTPLVVPFGLKYKAAIFDYYRKFALLFYRFREVDVLPVEEFLRELHAGKVF